uniref:Uncharacterized protein n=1 Tax=Rhizophora mucronata TaxID=61149 RepID=A0A2P2P0C4_RHIMU
MVRLMLGIWQRLDICQALILALYITMIIMVLTLFF